MNALILTGSPKSEGQTAQMARLLAQSLPGETRLLHAYSLQVAPCMDCGFCRTRFACPVQDEQQQVLQQLLWAQAVVVASPVYFYGVPAPLKQVFDRCQPFWCARVLRKEKPAIKKGAVLLAGGAPSHPSQFDGARQTISGWFREIGAESCGEVLFPGTDKTSLSQQPILQEQIKALAQSLLK